MQLSNLDLLAKLYGEAVFAESSTLMAYEHAKGVTEYERVRVALETAASGLLTGSTQKDRDAQAAVIVGKTESVALLEHYEIESQIAYMLALSSRKALETQISLTKAFLYSQQAEWERH